jgi:ActR/RegA family two-component response regulator
MASPRMVVLIVDADRVTGRFLHRSLKCRLCVVAAQGTDDALAKLARPPPECHPCERALG